MQPFRRRAASRIFRSGRSPASATSVLYPSPRILLSASFSVPEDGNTAICRFPGMCVPLSIPVPSQRTGTRQAPLRRQRSAPARSGSSFLPAYPARNSHPNFPDGSTSTATRRQSPRATAAGFPPRSGSRTSDAPATTPADPP